MEVINYIEANNERISVISSEMKSLETDKCVSLAPSLYANVLERYNFVE
ncbi:MAG: hypothetical protein N4A40_13330 [Tissierellales bacterium]|nr:hypothetical protein [Tissierellales bacterium]